MFMIVLSILFGQIFFVKVYFYLILFVCIGVVISIDEDVFFSDFEEDDEDYKLEVFY